MSETAVVSQKMFVRCSQSELKYDTLGSALANRDFESKTSSSGLSSLAQQFRENWLRCSPNFRETDDSLTNLTWLFEMSPFSLESDEVPVNPVNGPRATGEPTHPFAGSLLDPQVRMDYRTKWTGKPPFSYASLICLAMREIGKPKVTLSDIYGWIMANFAYYRHTDSSWQNSVRHNLSLNKCFEKVPREKGERGKGGFWRVNPRHADWLEANLAKCRRAAPPPAPPPPVPRSLILEKQNGGYQSLNLCGGLTSVDYQSFYRSPFSAVSATPTTLSSSASVPSSFSPHSLSSSSSSSSRSPNSFSSSTSSSSPYSTVTGQATSLGQVNSYSSGQFLPFNKAYNSVVASSSPCSSLGWTSNVMVASAAEPSMSQCSVAVNNLKSNPNLKRSVSYYESLAPTQSVRRRKTPPCSMGTPLYQSKSSHFLLGIEEEEEDDCGTPATLGGSSKQLRNHARSPVYKGRLPNGYSAFSNRKRLALSSRRATLLSPSHSSLGTEVPSKERVVKDEEDESGSHDYAKSSKHHARSDSYSEDLFMTRLTSDDYKDHTKIGCRLVKSASGRRLAQPVFSRPKSASASMLQSASYSLRRRRLRDNDEVNSPLDRKQAAPKTCRFTTNCPWIEDSASSKVPTSMPWTYRESRSSPSHRPLAVSSVGDWNRSREQSAAYAAHSAGSFVDSRSTVVHGLTPERHQQQQQHSQSSVENLNVAAHGDVSHPYLEAFQLSNDVASSSPSSSATNTTSSTPFPSRRPCPRVETQIRQNNAQMNFGFQHGGQCSLGSIVLPPLNSSGAETTCSHYSVEAQPNSSVWHEDFLEFGGVLPWQTLPNEEDAKLSVDCEAPAMSMPGDMPMTKSSSPISFNFNSHSTADLETSSDLITHCETSTLNLQTHDSTPTVDSGVASLINPSDGLDLGPLDLDFDTVSSALNEMVEANGPIPLDLDFTLTADLSNASSSTFSQKALNDHSESGSQHDEGVYGLTGPDYSNKYSYHFSGESLGPIQNTSNNIYPDWTSTYETLYDRSLFDLNSKT
uniref:Forkhead box protein J1.2 n=2 Tax=Schistocephalus solidus TaxID=70667 RepID=A0A0X3Q391_SCHSO